MNLIKRKKAQVWTTDFIIGLALFLIIIFVMVKILQSMSMPEESETYIDAVHLSSSLLTEGYPTNWTNDSVILPGIAKDNRINLTKLADYQNVPYPRTILLYQLSSDYIFFFSNGTSIINLSTCTYGYNISTEADCTPNLTSITYSDLSKMDRLVIINDTLLRMTVYAWK